jgi:hypothetical protein
MPRLIALLLLCFLSFCVSAQDVQLSFAGTTLTHKGYNTTNSAQLIKDHRLKAETSGYQVMSYQISILPKRNDLVGPFTIRTGEDAPQSLKTFLPNASGSKVFLDEIYVKSPDGKTRKSRSYVIACQ